ncbi:hypothetical protein ACTPEO_17175 [Clostridioides difficile]
MVKTEFVVTYQRIEIDGAYEMLKETFDDLKDALSFKAEKKQQHQYKNVDVVARAVIEILM